jgi:hypothetical protein
MVFEPDASPRRPRPHVSLAPALLASVALVAGCARKDSGRYTVGFAQMESDNPRRIAQTASLKQEAQEWARVVECHVLGLYAFSHVRWLGVISGLLGVGPRLCFRRAERGGCGKFASSTTARRGVAGVRRRWWGGHDDCELAERPAGCFRRAPVSFSRTRSFGYVRQLPARSSATSSVEPLCRRVARGAALRATRDRPIGIPHVVAATELRTA